MTRAVITGMGLIGPTGRGKDAFWNALLARRSAIGPLTRFDAEAFPCRIAGQVPDDALRGSISARKARTTSLVTQFALAAVEDALDDARFSPERLSPHEIGVVVGTAIGGWHDGERQLALMFEQGVRRANPFLITGSPCYPTGTELAARLYARGPQVTFSSGCPSSLQAIAHAAALVRTGELIACVTGGFEAPLTTLTFGGLSRTQELSTRNDAPESASRPFDRDHRGLVLSEGCCLLVVESEEHARARGAEIYAVILASAMSCDAQGLYCVDPIGESGAVALRGALERSGIEASELGWVSAHANSLPAFDQKEASVLRCAFGERAGDLPVSSIKGVMGHPFGAAGAFQTAAAALALQRRTLPPNTNLDEVDPACRLNLIRGEPVAMDGRAALVTSYGYGGVNAYLVLAGV